MKRAASNKIQQLQTWIHGIDSAMLTTADRLGHLRSRPMVVLHEMPDDALWFFSEACSHKIDDIHGHHAVNLAYVDVAGGKFVSVSGRARIIRDRAQMQDLWNSKLVSWFPKGAEDPELVLLRVEIGEAEMWQPPDRQLEVKLEMGNPSQSTHEVLTFA